MLEIGVDGTDREIDSGLYGTAPAGEDVLIIGHESLGEVVESSGARADQRGRAWWLALCAGPIQGVARVVASGEFDFCLTDEYQERGIKQRHGYMAEFFAERRRLPDPHSATSCAVSQCCWSRSPWLRKPGGRRATSVSGLRAASWNVC